MPKAYLLSDCGARFSFLCAAWGSQEGFGLAPFPVWEILLGDINSLGGKRPVPSAGHLQAAARGGICFENVLSRHHSVPLSGTGTAAQHVIFAFVLSLGNQAAAPSSHLESQEN